MENNILFVDNPTILTEVIETKKSPVLTAKNENTTESLSLWKKKISNFDTVSFVIINIFINEN